MRTSNAIFFLLLFLLTNCGQQEQQKVPTVLDTLHANTNWSDTTCFSQNKSLDEIPPHIDKLFEDFIFFFSENKQLQQERILFPLPIKYQKGDTLLYSNDWTHQNIFQDIEYYTIITERKKDFDIEFDTTLQTVNVECLHLKQQELQTFHFIKEQQKWFLTSIIHEGLEAEKPNTFISFFQTFANDSIFQLSHIQEPLMFVTFDPDDEFNILEANINAEQWFAFGPMLPQTSLIHFNYGQTTSKKHTHKTVSIKGIGNSLYAILHFLPWKREWKLIKYENLSN